MTATSLERPRRRLRRLLLLLLLIIPLVPEIVIYVTVALAHIVGCHLNQQDTCLIGGLPVSDVVGLALQACAGLIIAAVSNSFIWLVIFYLVIAGWLVACHIVIIQGWRRTSLRLLLGFFVTFIFIFLPYFGPTLAVAILDNENCRPNEGGIGPCMAFGGYVGSTDHSPAHDAIMMGWLAPYGAVMALVIFFVYAIVVGVTGVIAAMRSARSM